MIALYSGSFDPVTNGHMDIIARAANLFDGVIVGVFHNPAKPSGVFSPGRRVELIGRAAEGFPNVQARGFSGLLADGVKASGAGCIIRGVRSMGDMDAELQMARLNRQLCGVETLFLAASPETVHISASMVRQIGQFGGNLAGLVPEAVRQMIQQELMNI